MCIVLVLASLIPILSGYVIYLFVVAVATEAPLVVQLTLLAVVLAAALFGSWQLASYFRTRRRRRFLADEPSRVDELQERRSHEGSDQGHQHHHREEGG